jgi:hypothetical protein
MLFGFAESSSPPSPLNYGTFEPLLSCDLREKPVLFKKHFAFCGCGAGAVEVEVEVNDEGGGGGGAAVVSGDGGGGGSG